MRLGVAVSVCVHDTTAPFAALKLPEMDSRPAPDTRRLGVAWMLTSSALVALCALHAGASESVTGNRTAIVDSA